MPRPGKQKRRYISGLDGLRAISVLAVILYHLHIDGIDGGFLGVTVFFVLSGYLITDLLINEFEKNGRIDFKSFWIKRFRRLIPALVLMLVALVTWITLFQRSFLEGLREEVAAAFFYVSNWYYILQDHSYFTKFAPPSPLQHMWSLAVEEQFYIIWPILMLLALTFIRSKGKLAIFIVLLSFISAEAMAFMYSPDADPSRVYFGTDTRAFSILLGAALAFVWPSAKLSPNVTPDLKKVLNIAGLVSLGILIILMIFTQEDGSFLYYGGMYLASAVTAVLIAVIVHPANSIAKIFSIKPLLWIGERSYGIYIWHFPIIVLLGIAVKTDEINGMKILLALVLTFILSALSYRFVENPIRRGEWRNWLAVFRNGTWSWKWKQQNMKQRFTMLAISAIAIVFTYGMIVEPAPQASKENELEQHLKEEQKLKEEQQKAKKEQTAEERKKAKEEAIAKAKKEAKEAAAAEKKAKADEKAKKEAQYKKDVANGKIALANTPITALGDSVMLSAASALQADLPRIDVDATVALQVDAAIDKLRTKVNQGQVSNTVLIGLGSNGTFTKAQWEEIYELLGSKRQIFLMNVRVSRSWQDSVNKTIRNAAKEYDNVHEIDWYEASKNKPQIFYNDHIHPNPEGGKFYSNLVVHEIAKYKKKK